MKNEINDGINQYFNKNAIEAEEALIVKEVVITSKTTMCRSGLEVLINDAIKEAGFNFMPYNLATHGPLVREKRIGIIDYDTDIVGQYAGLAGWIEGLSGLQNTHKYGWVLDALNKSSVLKYKGHNSHRQINWWNVYRRYPSPGSFLTIAGKAYKNASWKIGQDSIYMSEIIESMLRGGSPSQVANRYISWIMWGTDYNPNPTIERIMEGHAFKKRNGRHWPIEVVMSNHIHRRWEETSRKKVHKLISKIADSSDHSYIAVTAVYEFSVLLGDYLYDKSLRENSIQNTYQTASNALSMKIHALSNQAEQWMLFNLKKGTDLLHTVKVAYNWDRLVEAEWDPKEKGSVSKGMDLLTLGYLGYRSAEFAAAAAKAQVSPEKYIDWEDRWLNRDKSPAFLNLKLVLPNDHTAEVMSKDDPEGLFAGYYVGCCQYPGGAGESCAWHGATNKDGCFFVIRNKKRDIIALSWVWRINNLVVLDNIEVSYRNKIPNLPLVSWYMYEILPKIKKQGYDKVYIGKGYSKLIFSLPIIAGPNAPTNYTDAKKVWVYG